MTDRPPLPPFALETAAQKVQAVAIDESERRIFGPRPAEEHGREIPLR